MHFSGMRTTRLLTVSHRIHQGVSATPPTLGRHPIVHAWIHTPHAQCMLGYTPPCPMHVGIHPPMDRQTPVKTLPSQTSFAGSKKKSISIISFAIFKVITPL